MPIVIVPDVPSLRFSISPKRFSVNKYQNHKEGFSDCRYPTNPKSKKSHSTVDERFVELISDIFVFGRATGVRNAGWTQLRALEH